MKKTYTKPQIDFDSFALSSTFAANCAATPNSDSNGCAVIIGGVPVFTDGVSGCKFVVTDGYGGICYYVPTGDSSIFVS